MNGVPGRLCYQGSLMLRTAGYTVGCHSVFIIPHSSFKAVMPSREFVSYPFSDLQHTCIVVISPNDLYTQRQTFFAAAKRQRHARCAEQGPVAIEQRAA